MTRVNDRVTTLPRNYRSRQAARTFSCDSHHTRLLVMITRMSDVRLRELERRWRASKALVDEVEYLRERVRAGDLTQEHLVLAAYCGSTAARVTAAGPVPENLEALKAFLDHVDPDAWVRLLVELLPIPISQVSGELSSMCERALRMANQCLVSSAATQDAQRCLEIGRETISVLDVPRIEGRGIEHATPEEWTVFACGGLAQVVGSRKTGSLKHLPESELGVARLAYAALCGHWPKDDQAPVTECQAVTLVLLYGNPVTPGRNE